MDLMAWSMANYKTAINIACQCF